MKRSLSIFLLIFSFFFLNSFTSPNDKHIGKWEGEDGGDVGYFIFDSLGYATMGMNGETMGGKEFIIYGQRAQMTYKIDYTTSPIQIDIILTDLESNSEKGRMRGIIEFLNANQMKMAMAFNSQSKRPINFKEDSIVLTRVE